MPVIYGHAGEVLANVPTTSDTNNALARTNRYGELVVNTRGGMGIQGEAEEGSYFRYLTLPNTGAAGPAGAAGIAMGLAATTLSDTAHIALLIRNTDVAGGKRIFLDYIRMICTVAGATTTNAQYAMEIDQADRLSVGATTLTVSPANSALQPATIADCRVGDITATAAGTNRKWLSEGYLRIAAAPCWQVGDEIYFNFADPGGEPAGGTFGIAATTASRIAIPCGPAVIGPKIGGINNSFLLHIVNIANATTAPSFAWEIGAWER